MEYPAHIRYDNHGTEQVQSVAEHCRRTAEYAAEAAGDGLARTAYLAGILHDMGKYTAAFRDYITRAAAGQAVARGSVNHTFAGVRFALERWHAETQSSRSLTCELISFAIGGHHGLFDCIDPDGRDGFLYRATKDGTGYEEARDNFLALCAGHDELDALFAEAEQETAAFVARCTPPLVTTAEEALFFTSLQARRLLSAVIEGDRRDTAEFMMDNLFPAPASDPACIWPERLAAVEARLAKAPSASAINRARGQISQQCRAAADRANGIYTLSVPTGGGKTLSGLRYALAAAAAHHKKRILFVVPLLSVLDQNAAVIREYVDDDSLILEHHSNVVQEKPNNDELNENELLIDRWSAPIIITTLVQLLNTLFLGKTSSVRRMQALADCVILIDEVQSVPRKLLTLFNLALNYLAGCCGATVVLCSATQPCLEDVPHPIRYAQEPALIPYDPALWAVFRRTEILDRRRPEGYTTDELAAFGLDCMAQQGSLLLICNTKAQARDLYTVLRHAPGADVFHLSTSMCMAHRVQTLKKINDLLAQKRPVLCVSTQLVEAGVDFSFACVIRISAGLENAIQAAGRCNRSGELARLCPVYIVNFRGENLSRLEDIRRSQQAAESVLEEYARDASRFEDDLASEASVQAYFRRLYTDMPAKAQDYPLPQHSTTLYDLLSRNSAFGPHCPTGGQRLLNQAFRTAGDAFAVFDDATTDVLVPYGEGEELITALAADDAKHDLSLRRKLLARAKHYSVSLYEYERKQLAEAGGIGLICDDTILTLQPAFYCGETGFCRDGNNNLFMEV